MMDIHQILKLLPHRYPILLVDRVLELETGKSIKALKNVTINEPFFMGHFPKGFYPLLNNGSLAIAFCFACLYLATSGPGPISVDAAIGKR